MKHTKRRLPIDCNRKPSDGNHTTLNSDKHVVNCVRNEKMNVNELNNIYRSQLYIIHNKTQTQIQNLREQNKRRRTRCHQLTVKGNCLLLRINCQIANITYEFCNCNRITANHITITLQLQRYTVSSYSLSASENAFRFVASFMVHFLLNAAILLNRYEY